MVWATSVTATGLLLPRERLGALLSSIDAVERGHEAKRRRARDRTSELAMWRAHWSSDSLCPSAPTAAAARPASIVVAAWTSAATGAPEPVSVTVSRARVL
jgi:hypothetical protein